MFKIIAIETLPIDKTPIGYGLLNLPDYAKPYRKELEQNKRARYNSVMRILMDQNLPQTYIFYHNYKIKSGRVIKDRKSQITEGHYSIGKTDINVCAIVGENGSGKSSIIELMLRLLNNTAYALQCGIDNNNSFPLHYAECVYARLYFEDNKEKLWCIEQKDHELNWYSSDTGEIQWSFDNTNKMPEWRIEKEKTCSDLDNCQKYLESLFYTIVVNYSAYALNIEDYRSEWIDNDELQTIKRHCLFTTKEIQAESDVNQQLEPHEHLQDEERCWIGSLFHKNDAYQTPIVINPYRVRGNIDYNREKSLLNDRLYLLLLDNKNAVTAMLGGKEPCSFTFDKQDEYLPINTTHGIFETRKVYEALNELNAFDNEIVRKNKNYNKTNKGKSGYEVSRQMIDTGNQIIDCWERCLGYRLVDNIKTLNLKDDEDKIAALNYIVYKTVKTTYNYSSYRKFQGNIISAAKLDNLIMTLYCDMTHLSLKLRRAVAFLTFGHYGTAMLIENDTRLTHTIDLVQFSNQLYKKIEKQDEIIQKLKEERSVKNAYNQNDFKILSLTCRGKWNREELLPTPSLKVSMQLELPDCSKIDFNTLSSGEKQIIYSLGTMVYHLHHINSVDSKKIQYSCVSLVFDEIELYFHPNYQRQLISRLIDVIGSLQLSVVKYVNIIMATHSPFILSDIPQDNILYLEKGMDISSKINVNPLGANINDILHHSFFLKDGFMGEHIRKKLEQILANINSNHIDCHKPDIEQMIKAMGDPFVREQLTMHYLSKICAANDTDELAWLERRLNELKKKRQK